MNEVAELTARSVALRDSLARARWELKNASALERILGDEVARVTTREEPTRLTSRKRAHYRNLSVVVGAGSAALTAAIFVGALALFSSDPLPQARAPHELGHVAVGRTASAPRSKAPARVVHLRPAPVRVAPTGYDNAEPFKVSYDDNDIPARRDD